MRSGWITDENDREFDVVLLCYHDLTGDPVLRQPGVQFYTLLDFKWWMIADLFEQQAPHLLKQYDSFYFLDDDIETIMTDINFLFQRFNASTLALAQPSLTYSSFMSWKALRHKKLSGRRYVSSVELMCPLMNQVALRELLPTFRLSKSGWGVDLLWGVRIREKLGRNKIAVFDVVQVHHGRPVGNGELYEKLDTQARTEEDNLRSQYNLQGFRIRQLPVIENFIVLRFFTYLYYQFDRMWRKS